MSFKSDLEEIIYREDTCGVMGICHFDKDTIDQIIELVKKEIIGADYADPQTAAANRIGTISAWREINELKHEQLTKLLGKL